VDPGPWFVAVAVLAGAWGAARGAHAGPPASPEPVRFAWVRAEGADECADQQHIAAEVAGRLGASPFSAEAARSIEVVVRRTKHGFHAVLYVRGPEPGRTLSRELTSGAADCASIEAAIVLAIALTIDPDASTRAPPAPAPPVAVAPVRPGAGSDLPAGPAPSTAAVPAPDLLAPPLPAALPPGRDEGAAPVPGVVLGASGLALRVGVGVGLLPASAPGMAVAGQVAVARAARVTVEALWMPEGRTSDGRFGFGLTAFSLGACFAPLRLPVVELALCGSAWGGALHAVVYATAPEAPGDSLWAAAAASPLLRLGLAERWHAELGGHLLVPLTRHPFVLAGQTSPVFRETPVTFFAFAGLGAHFR
jgi:hypothetical protein